MSSHVVLTLIAAIPIYFMWVTTSCTPTNREIPVTVKKRRPL